MRKKYYCKYCNKEISRYSANYGRGGCKICSAIHANRIKQQYYCLICNKQISYSSAKYGNHKCYSCGKIGHKLSEITKQKIREKLSGRKRPEISILMRAKGNHRPKCLNCGKELKLYTAKHCWSCYVLLGLNKGVYAPNYIDGSSECKYAFGFTHKLKLKIRKRDNYQCQSENCGMTEEEHIIVYGEVLTVHHIDYDKTNHNKENLTTVCKQCNIRVNYNREYWQKYFENKFLVSKQNKGE